MLDGKFNIYWKKGEKEKIRMAKWITNDTDSDEEELAEKYLPTEEEIKENHRKNEEALNWSLRQSYRQSGDLSLQKQSCRS